MPFNLGFATPTPKPDLAQLQLEAGQTLFVLGANGTGKSALMTRFAQQNQGHSRKISAHRQTWINSDALDLTSASKVQTEKHISNEDQQQQSRYRDQFAAQRASMTIYELIDAENVRARAIASAFEEKDLDRAYTAAKVVAPISAINELLIQSNIPIKISIRANERLMASKEAGPEYGAAQLSDGERNALLIAGTVLTVPADYLVIVDEPERHLHRSIIAPLLSLLFARRPDCAFVISTHDHDLPLEVSESKTLLIRSCNFIGENVRDWDADLLPANAQIDDVLKRDLLGSRRKILFVEGTESSLDKPLYSVIFPMVSVLAKGPSREVERSVVGVRAGAGLHWLCAFGITDGDGYDDDQIAQKREIGVYALPYYSVEAIYFHPLVIAAIAAIEAERLGGNAEEIRNAAIADGINAVAPHTERLSLKVAKKAARRAIDAATPSDDEIMQGRDFNIPNNWAEIQGKKKAEIDRAVEANNWESILTQCSVRETGALGAISGALGFQTTQKYQQAVRQQLSSNPALLTDIRGLFGDLFNQVVAE